MTRFPLRVQVFSTSVGFTLFIIALLSSQKAQAQILPNIPLNISYNVYDFTWIAAKESLTLPDAPTCGYCINVDEAAIPPSGSLSDLTVGIYRCDGVQPSELWAYQDVTKSIIVSSLTELLCVDAIYWNTTGYPVLQPCNSSIISQQWIIYGTDHQIVSELPDVNDNPLILWAGYPDPHVDPNNRDYTSELVINSSTPSTPGLLYTPYFSWLSTDGFVDGNSSDERFTSEGLLRMADFPVEKVGNGDFEHSTIDSGEDISPSSVTQNYPSYFALCGWVINYGPIDYVGSNAVSPESGQYSVHLNTYTDTAHWGSISQTFETEERKTLSLSFWFRPFPPLLDPILPSLPGRLCHGAYTEAILLLSVSNATNADKNSSAVSDGDGGFTKTFSMAATENATWSLFVVNFQPSSDVTNVSFTSLNFNGSCGPMIDLVSVTPLGGGGSGVGTVVAIVVGTIGALAVIFAAIGTMFVMRYRKKRVDYSGVYKGDHAKVYSMGELRSVTKKFSSVLGEEGSWTLYKAEFPDGTVGAVKVEKESASKVLVLEEISVLMRVHHRNLVNLTGYCIDKGRHYPVFEFFPNGGLHNRLHPSILQQDLYFRNPLSWKKRVKIAAEVACGLEYLHHHADPPITHGDIKSQNILLTATDSAKLANCGLSKATRADAEAFQSIATAAKGSFGYLHPQDLSTGVFSTKSDVYSYGVVLLELISGHPAIYNGNSLVSWAAPFMTDPLLYREMVDHRLIGRFDLDELEALVDLARMCMAEAGSMRPTMQQVVAYFNNKQLATEWSQATTPRETYHKMHPMDLVSPKDKDSSTSRDTFPSNSRDTFDTSSRDTYLSLMPFSPEPRD